MKLCTCIEPAKVTLTFRPFDACGSGKTTSQKSGCGLSLSLLNPYSCYGDSRHTAQHQKSRGKPA